ncbi:MAG: type II secretion system F family protein [Candidatus Omnitrophota bacterium]
MPKFIYTAKDSPQKAVQGEIEAESEQDAINKITRLGLFPVSVKSEDLTITRKGVLHLRRISSKEIVLFTRNLTTLIESGVNILNSIAIVSKQASNKYLRSVLNDISSKIKEGKSLSDSLISHPGYFSGLYTSMIHSGEVGGNLEQALKRLADYLEKEDEFKDSIRASLVYPAFVFSVGALTIIFLLTFVIPRLVTMFEDMGQSLPLPTKILIWVSTLLSTYGWAILLSGFVLVFFIKRFMKSQQGKSVWDEFILKRPFFGALVLRVEVSRLMRTLSLLLASGIPVVYAMDTANTVLDNRVLKNEIEKFKEKIKGGASFSNCLNESKLFPEMVVNIVSVGEETGTIEKSLLRIAEGYEKEVDRILKALMRLLEPFIILIMGLIVGFIVLSMLLPIFQINLIVR